MHPQTRKILYSLRLTRLFRGVFLKVNEGVMERLKKVEPYVTYGYVYRIMCVSVPCEFIWHLRI